MVASHLLKYCHLQEDAAGEQMEFRFLRDHNRREIDFIVLQEKRPLFAVECKTGEKNVSKHLSYFAKRTDIPTFYQVHLDHKDYEIQDIRTRVLLFPILCQLLKLCNP